MDQRRPARNGVKTPMNEYPELCLRIPLRQWVLIQGFECRLIMRWRLGVKTRKDDKPREKNETDSATAA